MRMNLSWRWFALAPSLLTAFGALASDIDLHSRQALFMTAADAKSRDRMLDVIATVYLPPTSAAQRMAFMECGNPLIEFAQENPQPVSEMSLFERARALQAKLAPNELINGPLMSKATCRTPNCGGTVELAKLPLIRMMDANIARR